jgi:hypothetical protein
MEKVLIIVMLVSVTGCTTQAWYDGVKQGAINQCEEIRDIAERDRCVQQQPNYQDYQQQRQELNKKP